MDSQIMVNVLDFVGMLSRLQSMQILGFVLAGVTLTSLLNPPAGINADRVNKTLCYVALFLVVVSIGFGIYPDISTVYIKYSLTLDLGGIVAVGKNTFVMYLVQLATAVAALLTVAVMRVPRPSRP